MSTSYTLLSFYGDFFMNARAGVELSIVPSNSALNVEHEWIVTASPRRACALSYGEGWKQSGSACVFEDAEKVIGENGLPKDTFSSFVEAATVGAHARVPSKRCALSTSTAIGTLETFPPVSRDQRFTLVNHEASC